MKRNIDYKKLVHKIQTKIKEHIYELNQQIISVFLIYTYTITNRLPLLGSEIAACSPQII